MSNQMADWLGKVRIVLVNTKASGNIGGAARAMKNMGLADLWLVEPREYPAPEASWRAGNAEDVLDSATVVPTLEAAISDCGLVIGTSARGRSIPWPIQTPREAAAQVAREAGRHTVAIVFGREDRGLTNEELQMCNIHLHIPANEAYSALNLATAVQVVCYELRMTMLTERDGVEPHFDDWDQPPVNNKELEYYYRHLQETLEKLDFITHDNPRQTMTRLRRLYSRARLDQMELNILRGILTATQNAHFHSSNRIAELESQLAAAKAALKK
jgi:tRNA (cytidine32/uridine32-2'-O)-methyltransferase